MLVYPLEHLPRLRARRVFRMIEDPRPRRFTAVERCDVAFLLHFATFARQLLRDQQKGVILTSARRLLPLERDRPPHAVIHLRTAGLVIGALRH